MEKQATNILIVEDNHDLALELKNSLTHFSFNSLNICHNIEKAITFNIDNNTCPYQ
jgi:hypothetical protein